MALVQNVHELNYYSQTVHQSICISLQISHETVRNQKFQLQVRLYRDDIFLTIWKWTGGPPKAVKPRCQFTKTTSLIRFQNLEEPFRMVFDPR